MAGIEGGRTLRAVGALVASCAAAALFAPAPTGAKIPSSLHDPTSCTELAPAQGHAAWRCDDGVPDAGGEMPNPDGAKAVTVPARYSGYRGLPPKAENAAAIPGADDRGNVALDVDLTLPDRSPPRRGFPLVVMMHGCCSGSKTAWQADSFDAPGERWHYSDAWFAARGYVVITYTARGFVDGDGDGSTGQTQLDSRSYEINDYQHLACQFAGRARRGRFDDVTGKRVRIDRRRVVATGGSYGGGFTWLALTDPRWRCGDGTGGHEARMRLAAAAPKYGWTDLVYSLLPTGLHSQRSGDLPDIRGCDSGPLTLMGADCDEPSPAGLPKRSILVGLYASGKTGVPPGSSHTTFPEKIDDAMACLEGPYPAELSPACADPIAHTLPEFLRERSAYYQNRFFRNVARRPGWRVPVFNAASFTDPLFPPVENVRMYNRLREAAPGYPIQVYHGDYQHFVQNKATEWGDVCESGADRHVCSSAEFTNGFDAAPPNRVRTGATTRLNRFIDHYARPPANRREPRPDLDVTASLQICPQNAGDRPAGEPGPRFSAPSFAALARHELRIELSGEQTTTSTVMPNPHALDADPVANLTSNGGRCPVTAPGEPAGPGVATYESAPLDERRTMIGATAVTAEFDASPGAQGVQLNARLYDVFPDGSALMVDRGPRVLMAEEIDSGRVRFELHGNGWRFPAGHRVRIELAQDDEPFLHRSDGAPPSSLALHGVTLRLPVRER